MEKILKLQQELSAHPVYGTLHTLEALRHFMGYHVFAVWDFMSLLKSLQRQITCISLPWSPSIFPTEMVRLINQIVLGEESDVDQYGRPCSHFELYIRAMEELGASTEPIKRFLRSQNLEEIPDGARCFVNHNLKLAQQGELVEVAASFFYGREKLVPEMFQAIVNTLTIEQVKAPTFLYYLERHIEVDSGEHGPLALKCLDHLTGHNEALKQLAMKAGMEALQMRKALWDAVLDSYTAKLSNC